MEEGVSESELGRIRRERNGTAEDIGGVLV